MKMLTVSLLVCAMMALTRAAAVPPAELDTKIQEAVELSNQVSPAVPPAEPDTKIQEDQSHAIKRAASCPSGWTANNGRCFLYVPTEMTWADAEKNCLYHGGNLVSVHSFEEHHVIQSMILKLTHAYPLTWIGGSDAEQEGTWFWSDGTAFRLHHWAPGQPDNMAANKALAHCLLMNSGDLKKFDDQPCSYKKPSVCAKKQ